MFNANDPADFHASQISASPQSGEQTDPHAPLRDDVRLLGNLLGDTLKQQVGQALFEKVEQIRHLAKQTRDGDEQAKNQLDAVLSNLTEQELLPVARAFTQFLNFANIAEQYHRVRRRRDWQSRKDTPPQAGVTTRVDSTFAGGQLYARPAMANRAGTGY